MATDRGERRCRARRQILRRAVRYAACHRVGLIWIDQDSNNQDDREDKEAGIQCMDLVYKKSQSPVGLLNFRVTRQEDVDILELLLSDEVQHGIGQSTLEQLNDITDFFEKLAADRCFTRSLILQETVCAGGEPSLSKSHNL